MELSFTLTPLQQGMLLQSIDEEARHCYVIQTVFAWEESIELTRFEEAWRILASGHEALRSSFRWKDTPQPQQVVSPSTVVDFVVKTIAGLTIEGRKAEVSSFLEADLARGFPLDSPPWRVTALQEDTGKVTAVWTFHHLLMDGRSHILLLKELLEIYDGLLGGKAVENFLEVPQHEHSQWMEHQDFSYAKEYWSQYLRAVSGRADFPQPHQAARSSNAHAFHTGYFGSELTGDLRRFAKASGVSVGNVIQASWAFVLGWLANETDIVIGAVRACRKSGIPNADHLIGMVISTLPLRVTWDKAASIGTILQTVSKDWHNFRQYEQTPLRQIRQWIDVPGSSELFSTALSYSSPHYLDAVFPDEETRRRRRIWLRQTTPYCSVDVSASKANVEISLNVPTRLVDTEIAGQLPDFLSNTVREVIAKAGQSVGSLSPLGGTARRQLIFGTNSRWEPPPTRIDWMAQISYFAARQPEMPAVEDTTMIVSWFDLERLSNRVAGSLQKQGVKPGDLIAVFLPRSPEFVWICLGILKVGAAYLPLDVQWPSERVKTVLEDARPFLTVSNAVFPEIEPCDGNLHTQPTPDSLAYVIYTSGSSGVPKGVEITHGGLQNLIDDAIATFSLTPLDRGCFLSNTAFDASVHEIWPLLAAGASLHLPDSENLQNPAGLIKWMGHKQISLAFVSVIMAEALTQVAKGRSLALRFLLTGGDQLRVVPAEKLPFEVVNEYGPTEYSVVATRFTVTNPAAPGESIPIGKPLRGTRAYVMNASQQLLPRGVPGELVLGGNGQARGYRYQAALTAEKFVAHHLAEEPSPTLYRTGDLVQWQEDGNLRFLGRIDFQVKLRGFRIELGEIEASLLKHPGVTEAVVIYQDHPEPRLVAFLVSTCEAADLAGQLRKLVPEYMVPSEFVFRDHLPTNTSGKYDRKLLAALALPQKERTDEKQMAFRSTVEKQVAEIWKEILHVPSVQPDDRFLSLGGTSLSIIKLLCAVNRDFGAELPVAEVFRNPTPGDLAHLIEAKGSNVPQPLVRLNGKGLERPLFFIPGAGGGIHWFRDLAEAMEPQRALFGLELLALSDATQADFSVESAAAEIADLITAEIHDSACSLCGYSGGGLLALATARSLQAAGQRVDNVFLLDTYPPPHSNSKLSKAKRWLRGWWSLPRGQRLPALRSRLSWLGQTQGQSEGAASEIEKDLHAIKQRHIQAFARHRIEPYAMPVSLFFSQDRPLSVRAAIHHDWSRYLTGDFSVTILRGDHYSLLRKENARELAKYLASPVGFAQTFVKTAGEDAIALPMRMRRS